jgi:hypothetical protein
MGTGASGFRVACRCDGVRTRRIDIAVLVAGVAILALLAFGREEAQRRLPPPSIYSTYDTGRNGYRALYDVLLASGAPLRRFERVLGLLDAGIRTLVISTYAGDPSPRGLDAADASALSRFVRGGGRLVVLDTDFAGSRDFTPGIGTSTATNAEAAISLGTNRFTAGVQRVGAPITAVFPFRLRRGIPLLANERGIVAVAYPYGKGEVVAITAPAAFSNAFLRNDDNLAFAYNVVTGHGPAAFDEYVHGYDDDLGFWQGLPAPVHAAFWIVVAIVLLALIGANVPFAPPIPAQTVDRGDTSAYVDAMAALMRRARAARAATATFAADAARRARGRDHPGTRAAVADLERLRDLAHPSDAVVMRAAVIDFRLRKDLA